MMGVCDSWHKYVLTPFDMIDTILLNTASIVTHTHDSLDSTRTQTRKEVKVVQWSAVTVEGVGVETLHTHTHT